MKVLARNTIIAITAVTLYAWVAADDWEHELELERAEQQRLQAIREYELSKLSSAQSEDDVDVTPLPTPEPEPVYMAPTKRAKTAVVKTKRQIKRRVKATTQ